MYANNVLAFVHQNTSLVYVFPLSSPVDVNIVVVSENSTEAQSNLATEKILLAQSAITSLTTADPSGNPSTALQGGCLNDWIVR